MVAAMYEKVLLMTEDSLALKLTSFALEEIEIGFQRYCNVNTTSKMENQFYVVQLATV